LLAVFRLPESLSRESESAARSFFDRTALRAAVSLPSIGLLLVASFVAVFSFANFESTLSLQIANIVRQDVGQEVTSAPLRVLLGWIAAMHYDDPDDAQLIVVFATFAYLGIILTLAQGFLVRRLSGRMSEGTMATMGALTAILGFTALAWAARRADFTLLLGAMALEVVGFAFVNPSLQSLISRRSDPRLQGSILGLGQSMSSLARILGPVCGVSLLERSQEMPYWVASLCMALGLAMILPAVRGGKDFVEREPAA
jgi:MFS family permease